MISGIYTLTNLVNGKLYVGYGVDMYNRKATHFMRLRKNKHANDYLQQSFNKYGEENFLFEELERCEEKYLCALEHYWATILNTHDRKYGYNILPTHPEGIKISHSLETKEKLRQANLGKRWTIEQKQKASLLRIGKKKNMNYEKALQKKNQAIKRRKKIKEDSKKYFNDIKLLLDKENVKVKSLSDYSESIKLPILQIDKITGEILNEWDCSTNAAKTLGFKSHSSIRQCCKKLYKSAYGFIWEYKIKENEAA